MESNLLIYGAGGFAREVAWLAEESGWSVAGLIDDDARRQGTRVNDLPVISFEQAVPMFSRLKVVLAVGSPKTRKKLAMKVRQAGGQFATLIHPDAKLSGTVEIREGVVITTGNILTVNIRVGNHVHVNLGCTVGHDAVLEDFVTLAPGVHVSGWVHLREGVYVGTGAVIINGTEDAPLVIGPWAVVGAGAVVVQDVPAHTTVVGVPARPLSPRKGNHE